MSEPLLSPRLLARLERLQLGTRQRLAGVFCGEHRSPRAGSSVDFADYREYQPGDDFRRIDYNLYARLGAPLIKLFDAEDDLNLRLVVDASASMGYGGKLAMAQRLAAALGFVALVRRDVVTLATFPGSRAPQRFVGRSAAPQLFSSLATLDAAGPTTIAAAVNELVARPGPRGLTVLVSDLLSNDSEEALHRLPARGGEVAVVHVWSREDLQPDLAGDLDLVDAESGARVAVSATPDLLARYHAAARGWADAVAAQARQVGAGYARVAAEADVEAVLTSAWRAQGLLR